MNPTDLAPLLQKLKQFDFSNARGTFWIVKRTGPAAAPKFKVCYVDTHPHLQEKLAKIVADSVDQAKRAKPYDYLTDDLEDDEALVITTAEATFFEQIQEQVNQGSAAERITSQEQLHDSWAYLIDVEANGKHLRAYHKIMGGWALKKEKLTLNILFQDATLVDFDEKPVFQIFRKIDFLAYEDCIFVLDKSKFEHGINFRTGMERKRDELLDEFAKMNLFTDLNTVRDKIGTNLRNLRRVAGIKKNGYYKDANFLTALKTTCNKYGWDVAWKDNQIVVTQQNVEVILVLLNNDRLESPVNCEVFDVSVKDRVK